MVIKPEGEKKKQYNIKQKNHHERLKSYSALERIPSTNGLNT